MAASGNHGLMAGILLWAAAAPLPAREGLWAASFRTQGFYDFEPGNDYLVGPEIAYSNFTLARHSLQLKAAYLTSRAEWVFRENILRQDYFLLSPAWHFRRERLFDPMVQLDLGYSRFDVEEEDIFGKLDNDSWIASFQLGVNLNLAQGAYGAFYHFGYNFITSSVVFPGVFGVGIWMLL